MSLFETRKELILKGWVNKSEIEKFVPCGRKTAKKIYDVIQQEVKANGFEMLKDCIRTERLIEYMGLDRKDYL